MKNIFIILVSFVFFTSSFAQKNYVTWKIIFSPKFSSIKFVDVNSVDDFWLLEQTGYLFHYSRLKWEKFPLPNRKNLSGYHIGKIGVNHFIVTGYDSKWNTQIYFFDNGRWTKDSLIIKNPINTIKVFNKNLIYLAGDWATLYRLTNGKWRKMVLHFKSHFKIKAISDTEMWLGTRGEGIYKFNGKTLKKYKIENNITPDIASIIISDSGKIIFTTSNGNVYSLQNNIFQLDTLKIIPAIQHKLGFIQINNKNLNAGNIEIAIPNKLGMHDFKLLDNKQFILISEKNKIYKSEIISHNLFFDEASDYQVEGHAFSNTKGAAFIYLNDDDYPDLFLLNSSQNYTSSFYINRQAFPFLDITKSVNLFLTPPPYLFNFGDFNGDNLTDVATITLTKKGPELTGYQQNKNNQFVKKNYRIFSRYYKPFTDLQPLDFDTDGKLDMDISTFFNSKLKAGNELLLINKRWNGVTDLDTNYAAITKGWTKHTIFADFNGDGLNDWLLIKQWQKVKLLVQDKKQPGNFSVKYLPIEKTAALLGAVVFDFDNDGDLDILTSSDLQTLSLFVNDSHANFRRKKFTAFNSLNKLRVNLSIKRSIVIGDFNNDGFVDFIFALNSQENPRNYFFVNDSGKTFYEASNEYNIVQPYLNGLITADVDADGDLDVFGYMKGKNVLWINNLNNKNFIEIIPVGVVSNTDGIGAKVSVYDAGFLNDKNHLKGSRQIGTDNFSANNFNQLVAHFGVKPDRKYDIKINFYGGNTKILRNVKSGQILKVHELTGLIAAAYLLPGSVMRFLSQSENQLYILITAFIFLIIFFGGKIGITKYKWNSKTLLLFVVVNISIFWLLLFTNTGSTFFLRFFFPLIAVFFGAGLPLFLSYTLKKSPFFAKNREEIESEFFQKILLFTHGEWALRNISGLQLLFNNIPQNNNEFPNYLELIKKRKDTFIKITYPLLKEIIRYMELLNFEIEKTKKLKSAIYNTQKSLGYFENSNTVNTIAVKNSAKSFDVIGTLIREIRDSFISKNSCSPENIVLKISDEFKNEFQKDNVKLRIFKNFDNGVKAFIKDFDLGIVIDNCIQNSLKALKGNASGELKIIILKKPPKIVIDITDNGIGLKRINFDKIFQKGFSEFGTEGSGLFISRKILGKYNGRIFVKESKPQDETTISIELKEGL